MPNRIKRTYTPGEKIQDGGQLYLLGSRGKRYDREITLAQDKTVPATPKPGQKWYLGDLTKHKTYSNS